MDKDSSRKIMTVSFVVTGAVLALVVNVILEALAASFGVVARFHSQDWVRHGLPVGVGLVTFAALQFNPKVVAWADEVLLEASKVVWPSRKDTMAMTMVTCVMLLIASFILGFFDFVSGGLVRALVN